MSFDCQQFSIIRGTLKEMGGAGEGVGTPEQRAQASAGQRKAQQMRQTSKAVAATPKAPKGKQPRGRG